MRSLIGGILDALRTPVPFTPRTGTGLSMLTQGSKGDDQTNMEAMGANSTVYAIVHRTTEALAGVDWHLYRKHPSGEQERRTIVPSHPALGLWNKPNDFYTRQLFVETTTQHLILTGKAPWVVARVGKATPPMELWPVRPDRINPVKDPDKFQTGWIYKVGSDEVPLDLNEVIRMRIPDPLDPYNGLGPVQALAIDLQSSQLAAEYNRMFFLNSAEPGGIVQVDRRLSDDEFNEMRDRWQEQHKGVSRAHRVAILEQAEWVERNYTRRDMQYAELRTDSREVTREGFGMPKAMLGSVDDINRANAEANEVVFARWLLVGALERLKGAMNYNLLPMYGKGTQDVYEFDYDSPVPEDVDRENATLTAKWAAAVLAVQAGFDPVVMLEALGLPAVPYERPALPAPVPAAAAASDPGLAARLNGHHPVAAG
jgi:HK97 family phage portal protein